MTFSVVLVAADGLSTRIVYHALVAHHPDLDVLVEGPVSKISMLKKRAKRLGWLKVAGQAAFLGAVVPLLTRTSLARRREILGRNGFVTAPLPRSTIRVGSINSEEARRALRALAPTVVVVNGTRIISGETLASVDALFVNMHAGITPRYRGTHGGYWALAEGRPDLAGTTVHLVDTGIDTGTILAQAVFKTDSGDNFTTYPLLHLEVGIPLLLSAIADVLAGAAHPVASLAGDLPSRLLVHPTLGRYLRTRLDKGVG